MSSCLQPGDVNFVFLSLEGRARGDIIEAERHLGFERQLVGPRAVAHIQAPVEPVDGECLVRLRIEARGAQDDDGQPVLLVDEAAELFGGQLGDVVDVAGLGYEFLGHPNSAVSARLHGAPVHRRGAGVDEALAAMRHGSLEQVEHALHVHVDEARLGEQLLLRRVQRRYVDHRVHSGDLLEGQGSVLHGAQHLGEGTGDDVQPNDSVRL